MPQAKPQHPGVILRTTIMPYLNMGVTDFAKHLHVSRVLVSRILHGRTGISPEVAIRLEAAGLSKASVWMSLQSDYELWMTRKNRRPRIARLVH